MLRGFLLGIGTVWWIAFAYVAEEELVRVERNFEFCNVSSLLQDLRNMRIFDGDGVLGMNAQAMIPRVKGIFVKLKICGVSVASINMTMGRK